MVNWHKQNGGAYLLGIDTNNIAEFLPSSISDIVCWIRADPKLIRSQTLGEYISNQPTNIQQNLMAQHRSNLQTRVVTEIVSDTPLMPISFVRDETALPTAFPVLQDFPGKIASIDISNYVDPATKQPKTMQLITNSTIELPEIFSSYSIWRGVKTEYLKSYQMLRIYSDLVETPQMTQDNGITLMVPTAELRELIIYARELTAQEALMLEGYIAYKRNDQYTLPFGHPYLPEVSYTDPVFAQINTDLKPAEDTIAEGLKEMVALYEKYKMYKGHDNIAEKYGLQRQLAQTALSEIHQLRMGLSKGALFARKDGSVNINAIYRAIATNGWDKNAGFSSQTMATYIGTFKKAVAVLEGYINTLRNFELVNSVPVGMSGGGVAPRPAMAAATTFYSELRVLDNEIKTDGATAYSAIQTKAYQLAQNILEILEADLHTEISAFEAIQTTPWHPVTNPKYAFVEAYKAKIAEYITTGDYAYLITTLKTYMALAESVVKDYLNCKPNVIFSNLYLGYMEHIERTCRLLVRETAHIKDLIHACFQQNATIQNPDIITPVIDPIYMNTMLYISGIKKRFIRHVSREDAFFTGLEYIETDGSGIPVRDDVLGIVPIFPAKMGLSRGSDGSSLLLNGKEEFVVMTDFTDSVIHYIYDVCRPALHETTLTGGGELDRMKVNSIYSIRSNQPTGPVVLPSNGVIVNSFYIIHNTGITPFCVLNPGKLQQRTSVGPGEALLFVYINQDNMYGLVPWAADYVPYDSLLDAPRSSYSCFVPELGTEIYVRETSRPGAFFEPVYDANWNFVQVQRAADGLVYDIDDVNHANPYSVNTGVQQSVKALALHPKTTYNIHVPPTIYVTRDQTTGVGLLCLASGLVPNEFGYCKATQTPLQFIQGSVKIGGAYGDLILTPAKAQARPYPLEPYLNYDVLFTTTNVMNVNPTTQIYVTHLSNPIVSPDGALIEINPKAVTPPTAMLATGLVAGLRTQPYNPIDIPSVTRNEMAQFQNLLAQQHYHYGMEFIQNLRMDLEKKPNEIVKFGDETYSLNKSINVLLDKMLRDIPTITGASLDGSINEYMVSYEQILVGYEPYKERVEALKSYRYQLDHLNTEGQASIQEYKGLINSTEQTISTKTGMINIVAIQPLKVAATEQGTQFLIAINTIENMLSNNSVDDIQSRFDAAEACVANLKRMVEVDLLHAVAESSKQYKGTIVQKISAMSADIMSKARFCKKIALWLGSYSDPDQTAYNRVAPAVTQVTDPDIYSRYSNPLFVRDWYNVPNIQADALKHGVAEVTALISNLPSFSVELDVDTLLHVKSTYEGIAGRLEQPLHALKNGVVNAYGVISAASVKLQADNRGPILQKIATTNELVRGLDAKFLAAETLQLAGRANAPAETLQLAGQATAAPANLQATRASYEQLKATNAALLNTDITPLFDRLDQMTLNNLNQALDKYMNQLRQIAAGLV